jgi:hypothetical protein
MHRKSYTVDARHPNVRKHKIESGVIDQLNGLRTVVCLRDFITLFAQKMTDKLSAPRFIVND